MILSFNKYIFINILLENGQEIGYEVLIFREEFWTVCILTKQHNHFFKQVNII